MARPLYCAVDPALYAPEARDWSYDLGYMGTYSADRQAALQGLLVEPARRWPRGRFVVAGPLYPASICWPANVARIDHLPPSAHRSFYNAQRFTLNITRTAMRQVGYAPSVRLFEAAACATPIISDAWPGLETFSSLGQRFSSVSQQKRRCSTCTTSRQKNASALGARARRASWPSIQPSIGRPHLRDMC